MFAVCRGSAVCFAFGQTGAGKTYTLLGSKAAPGMFELAGADLFAGAASHGAGAAVVPGVPRGPLHIWASYYEIYCGHIYDLFNKRKRCEWKLSFVSLIAFIDLTNV